VSKLRNCVYADTPYQRQPVTKNNSFICLHHSSESRVKRVRLFATSASLNEDNTSVRHTPNEPPCIPVRTNTIESLLMERNDALCYRDSAISDRDKAYLERDEALRERDAAVAKKESIRREIQSLRIEWNGVVA
jgi:hypothetical protein